MKMTDIMKKELEGSYTVEAAFLVPIVLGIVFTLLYTLFILHDRAILQGNINELLQQEIAGENKEQTVCRSVLEEGLWCMEIKECSFQKKKWKKKVTALAQSKWNIPVLAYFMNNTQRVERSESCMTLQPEVVMRYGLDFWKDKTDRKEKDNGTKSDDG